MPQANDTGQELVDVSVRRDDWRQSRTTRTALPATLTQGQVLLRVDRFALTSNNVSYALTGDLLGYWTFFPPLDGDEAWGRIPVMGFADVVASQSPDARVGERVFGFFPMATHLVVEAGDASAAQFVDVAAHRRATALPYRQYLRTSADAQYDPAREDQVLLLRGLFLTSFLMDDFLADNGDFGAQTFLITSASSKTAIALAWSLAARKAGRVVGLTSARNRDFVASLGCYDVVTTYDDLASLDRETPAVLVDHSGDGRVVDGLHHHFADRLRHSAIVGATHWSDRRPARDLPGAPPTFFFAPGQLEKRRAEWGAAGFDQRLGAAWRAFLAFSDRWLRVVRGSGADVVEATWRDVLEGRARPDEGHVLSLWAASREGRAG